MSATERNKCRCSRWGSIFYYHTDKWPFDSKKNFREAMQNGEVGSDQFKQAIENTEMGVSDLKGPAVKNIIDAIKDMGKQEELDKDQIAAVDPPSKLGNYDHDAMQDYVTKGSDTKINSFEGMEMKENGVLVHPKSNVRIDFDKLRYVSGELLE